MTLSKTLSIFGSQNSDLDDKADVISFSYSGGNTDTDIKNALYQNWSKFPNGSSLMQFSNSVEIWNGVVNKYDSVKGSVLIQAAGTGAIKKYVHNGTLLYSMTSTTDFKIVDASNATIITIQAGQSQKLSLPAPAAAEISGYILLGCVTAWMSGTVFIPQSGYIGNVPGADIYFTNFTGTAQSGTVSARYLYVRA